MSIYEYVTEKIPYSLLETEQIEAYLTEKARKGLLLAKASQYYPQGRFKDRAPGNYQYSAAMYGRRMTK